MIISRKIVSGKEKGRESCYSSISADGSTVFIENQIQKMSLITATVIC